jgi:hypothetical protein
VVDEKFAAKNYTLNAVKYCNVGKLAKASTANV